MISKLLGKKILIVEDELDLLNTYQTMFRAFKMDVDTAANGVQGLSALNANRYDIVLTDINMPQMNGIEMLKNARFEIKPLIYVLTAHAEMSFITEADALGINGYILKPVNLQDVVENISRDLN